MPVEPDEPPQAGARRSGRDRRIDVFRGLALLTIFVDHVDGSPWSAFTLREFGLVSALDVFVLLAGVSGFLAYGAHLRRGGDGLRRLGRRMGFVYAGHLLTVVLTVGLALSVDRLWPHVHAIKYFRVGTLVQDPGQVVPQVLLLHVVPWRCGVLPMYLVLLPTLPVIVWLVRRWRWLPVALGVVLLVGATLWQWRFPWVWAKEPLAWFLVYAAGVTLAAWPRSQRPEGTAHRGMGRWKAGSWLTAVAVGWLVVMMLADAPWQAVPGLGGLSVPGLDVLVTSAWSPLIRPLGLAALVWLVIRWVPATAAWLERPSARAVGQVGRHSLPMYVIGLLLADVASVVSVATRGSIVVTGALTMTGIAVLLAAARLWPDLRSARRPPVSVPHQRPAPVAAEAPGRPSELATAPVES
ncbi:MAG: OpgC domain-containing protein [Nocardioidaceae bacterium]|nr:OpgC domain-containing protein [Nocardioidaceae bacterium]